MKAFAVSDKSGGGWWSGSGWTDNDRQAKVVYSRSGAEMLKKEAAGHDYLIEEVDDEEIGPKAHSEKFSETERRFAGSRRARI